VNAANFIPGGTAGDLTSSTGTPVTGKSNSSAAPNAPFDHYLGGDARQGAATPPSTTSDQPNDDETPAAQSPLLKVVPLSPALTASSAVVSTSNVHAILGQLTLPNEPASVAAVAVSPIGSNAGDAKTTKPAARKSDDGGTTTATSATAAKLDYSTANATAIGLAVVAPQVVPAPAPPTISLSTSAPSAPASALAGVGAASTSGPARGSKSFDKTLPNAVKSQLSAKATNVPGTSTTAPLLESDGEEGTALSPAAESKGKSSYADGMPKGAVQEGQTASIAGGQAAAATGQTGVANFAAAEQKAGSSTAHAHSTAEKVSVTSGIKQDTETGAGVGTGGAQGEAMPRATSQHPPTAFALAATGSVAGRGAEAAATGGLTATAQSTAQAAVDAVMKVADVQAASADTTGQVVNLGFNFGDEHLAVRVEMKNGEVHTRFTSSSPELHEAVATQWSSMNSGANSQGQRSYHFANPEFVSSGSSGDSSQSGQSFSFQHGQTGADDLGSTSIAGGRFTGSHSAVGSNAAATTEVEPAASDRSLHLHAFA
jgi:hypothetical protein